MVPAPVTWLRPSSSASPAVGTLRTGARSPLSSDGRELRGRSESSVYRAPTGHLGKTRRQQASGQRRGTLQACSHPSGPSPGSPDSFLFHMQGSQGPGGSSNVAGHENPCLPTPKPGASALSHSGSLARTPLLSALSLPVNKVASRPLPRPTARRAGDSWPSRPGSQLCAAAVHACVCVLHSSIRCLPPPRCLPPHFLLAGWGGSSRSRCPPPGLGQAVGGWGSYGKASPSLGVVSTSPAPAPALLSCSCWPGVEPVESSPMASCPCNLGLASLGLRWGLTVTAPSSGPQPQGEKLGYL